MRQSLINLKFKAGKFGLQTISVQMKRTLLKDEKALHCVAGNHPSLISFNERLNFVIKLMDSLPTFSVSRCVSQEHWVAA
jgi:hypothetical protein